MSTQAYEDPTLVQAGLILTEYAKQAGVDLASLSDDDLSEMLVEIRSELEAREGGDEDDEGDDPDPETPETGEEDEKMAANLTVQDVSRELSKIASDNGIDLNTVSRAEYDEAFNSLATRMQTPVYYAEKRAEAEAMEKIAEADIIGRQMARSFLAELNDTKTASAVERAMGAAGKKLERLGKGTVRTLGRTGGGEAAMNPVTAKRIGAGVLGAGALATGGAAAALSGGKKKESGEEFAAGVIEVLRAVGLVS